MKKITVFIILTAICIGSLCACSEKRAEGKDAFYSPAVIAELFDDYYESVMKNVLKPEASAYAEDEAEYTYMTEDGAQSAHTALTSYFTEDGTLGVTVDEHEMSFSNGLIFDGQNVGSITDKTAIQRTLDTFIKAFCKDIDKGSFETAPDSIRAAEDDVDVDRVTLKLDKDVYVKAFEDALTALKNDIQSKKYLTDLLGFYAVLHNREESAEETFEALISKIEGSVKDSEGQLVWQRYVYNGKTVAARLKYGENVIRYICAEAVSYTELELSVLVGGSELSLSYGARRTGMSDTYNIRISNGDEITYFDGTAESAYKSGNIGFELRATKNANVINGCKLDVSFSGEKKLTYKGNGNLTVKGDKKTFSFELVFNTAENVTVTPAQNGDISLYEAVKKVFY